MVYVGYDCSCLAMDKKSRYAHTQISPPHVLLRGHAVDGYCNDYSEAIQSFADHP